MAIAPLENRLDALMQEQETAAPDPGAELAGATDTAAPTLTPDSPQFEPVQVAGLGLKSLIGVLKAAPKRTEVPIIKPGEAMEKVGPYQVIRDAAQQQAEDVLKTAPTMPTVGKPSPKQPGVPATTTNLANINGPDDLKQHIEAVGRQYGADKIGKVSFDTIKQQALANGYDGTFLARILDTAQATKADPKEAWTMLQALTDAGKVAFDLGEKVKAAQTAGQLTPELAADFRQAVALEGVLANAVRGRGADIARTLGVFRMAREAGANRGPLIEAILDESGGIASVHDLASKYTALSSASARALVASKSLGGTIKDVWMSTWINGILSGPVTHAVNVAGSFVFSGYSVLERGAGSLVGKARNMISPGGEAAVDVDEVASMAWGWLQGLREGAVIGGRTFAKNEPSDPLTKIELALGRDAFDIDMGGSDFGQAASKALQYWGGFVTLPGRALMAEDDFFKAVGYRMQVNALASRQASAEYRRLVEVGVAPDQAKQQSAALMAQLLDPATMPSDMDVAAKEFGRTITFNRELEQSLQGVQRVLNNPLMKMFVPFVRTPTNIALETMARSPAFWASPRFWSDFNAGGVRKDMAIGRVTLGSGLLFATGSYALDGKVTGYGPMRTEDKKLMEATGWQPFSFVMDNKDVSPELMEQFKRISTVSQGPDKTYVSYARLEPLSTLLAMGATAGEYSMMTPGDEDMDQMFQGGAMGLYTYLGEQPMLQGVAEIVDVLSSQSKDVPSKLYDLLRGVTAQVGSVMIGGSPLGAHSSLVATVERYMDPTRSSTMAPMMGGKSTMLEGAERGFWEAVQKARSRNPLTSDDLPRDLDPITGEALKVGKGNLYETWSPIKISDGKYSPAHTILQELMMPLPRPEKTMDGVMLSNTQYNRLISIATEGGALESAIVELGKSDRMLRLMATDLSSAQALMNSQISAAYSAAKQQLISEDDELRQALEDVKSQEAVSGKYKR